MGKMVVIKAARITEGGDKEMEDKKLLGKLGEDLAAAMLYSKGYSILTRNFRSHYGEIDVICVKDGTLYFVEVKTRTSEKFGEPEEAVSEVKQFRMKRTAEYYLTRNSKRIRIMFGEEPAVMFKVVEILIRETEDSLLSIL